MIDDHASGAGNYTRQLRSLIVLELWQRMFVDKVFRSHPDV